MTAPRALLILLALGATPLPATSVWDLAKQADAVVVASAGPVVEDSLGFDRQIQVLRVLQGTPAPGAMLRISYSRTGWKLRGKLIGDISPLIAHRPSPAGLYFLTKTDGDVWRPLRLQAGVPIEDNFATMWMPVAAELSAPAALWRKDREDDGFPVAFAAEVISAIQLKPAVFYPLLGELRWFGDAVAIPALKRIRDLLPPASDDALMFAGMLIQRGDGEGYADFLRLSKPLLSPKRIFGFVETFHANLRTEPEAIAGLAAVYAAPWLPVEIRYAAARSLAEIHADASLPVFADMLFDRDPVMQAYGAVGIASVADRQPHRSDEAAQMYLSGFRPKYYKASFHGPRVAFWQDWWKANSALLLPNPRK